MPIPVSGLILETGSGLSNANSYQSLSGASGYFAGIGNDAWAEEYTAEEQAQALVTATRFIDLRWRFVGSRVGSGQALEWPRYGGYDTDMFLWEDCVPPVVAKAACEYALLAISGTVLFPPRDSQREGAISSRSETIGPHTESFSYAFPLRLDLPRYPEQDSILKKSGLVRARRRTIIRG